VGRRELIVLERLEARSIHCRQTTGAA
jgi:hypothetical protein